jgi:hypothetical protein
VLLEVGSTDRLDSKDGRQGTAPIRRRRVVRPGEGYGQYPEAQHCNWMSALIFRKRMQRMSVDTCRQPDASSMDEIDSAVAPPGTLVDIVQLELDIWKMEDGCGRGYGEKR